MDNVLRPVSSGRTRRIVKTTAIYVIMVLLLVFFLFPFAYMFLRSLMTGKESMIPENFFPSQITFESYKLALDVSLLRYFGNTLYVIVFNCIAVPVSAALCAYGFSKIKFQGSSILFSIVLATMMLPAITVQIPLFVIYVNLGWLDTLLPLTIPNLFGGGAVNIFLIRQFMKGIPNDILNAGKIDGASSFRIFWKIVIPLCFPVLMLIVVNTFIGVWNDFMGPLLYLRSDETKFTLAIGIYKEFLGKLSSTKNFPSVQMAVGTLMVIPPAILFFIFQKQLIDGVTMTGLKG